MQWTEERVERLKTLWADGVSATMIAVDLGGISRNAAIGKAHRLGLTGRKKPETSSGRVGRPRVRKPRHPQNLNDFNPARKIEAKQTDPGFAEPTQAEPVGPSKFACTLVELTDDTCRFPIGDPQDRDNFHFCGAPPLTALPYCGEHCRIAYRTREDVEAERRRPTNFAVAGGTLKVAGA